MRERERERENERETERNAWRGRGGGRDERERLRDLSKTEWNRRERGVEKEKEKMVTSFTFIHQIIQIKTAQLNPNRLTLICDLDLLKRSLLTVSDSFVYVFQI